MLFVLKIGNECFNNVREFVIDGLTQRMTISSSPLCGQEKGKLALAMTQELGGM